MLFDGDDDGGHGGDGGDDDDGDGGGDDDDDDGCGGGDDGGHGGDDGGGGDYWSYKSCKAPVISSPPTNQHPVLFYRPDALPVSQPTVSKH